MLAYALRVLDRVLNSSVRMRVLLLFVLLDMFRPIHQASGEEISEFEGYPLPDYAQIGHVLITEDLSPIVIPLDFRFSLQQELMSLEQIADHFKITTDDARSAIAEFQASLDSEMASLCTSNIPAGQMCPLIRHRRSLLLIAGAVVVGIILGALATYGGMKLYEKYNGSDDSIRAALEEQQREIDALRDSLNEQIAHDKEQDRTHNLNDFNTYLARKTDALLKIVESLFANQLSIFHAKLTPQHKRFLEAVFKEAALEALGESAADVAAQAFVLTLQNAKASICSCEPGHLTAHITTAIPDPERAHELWLARAEKNFGDAAVSAELPLIRMGPREGYSVINLPVCTPLHGSYWLCPRSAIVEPAPTLEQWNQWLSDVYKKYKTAQ